MPTPEDSREAFASPNQLQALFWTIQTWLQTNGDYVREPFDEGLGTEGGLRISEHPSSYTLKVPAEVAHKIIPEAAGILAIEKLVQIDFQPAYYALDRLTDSLSHTASSVGFSISRKPPAIIIYESLWISGPDATEPWATDRLEQASENLPPASAGRTAVQRMLDAWALENELGTYKITALEFDALTDIAAHLDELKQESL